MIIILCWISLTFVINVMFLSTELKDCLIVGVYRNQGMGIIMMWVSMIIASIWKRPKTVT